MATRRTKRLGALLQAELADLLLRRVKDPRMTGVSITGVDVSPDMRQAKVYYSPLDEQRRAEVEAGFEAASPFLRGQLAARLHLKIIPRLTPVYDASLTRGAEMDALIRQVRERDRDLAGRSGDDDDPNREA